MYRGSYSLMLALATIATPAVADMTATFIAPNNAMTMKVEIASNGDVRGGNTSPTTYFITRDGHGYIVQATFDGPAVMRAEDMATVMAEQMKKMMPDVTWPKDKSVTTFPLRKGGVVTIRGRQGIAYYMGPPDAPKPFGDPFLVISTDPALAPLGAAMARQFDISIAMMGRMIGDTDSFKNVQDLLKTGAPLVFTGMQLESVSVDPIPAARFVLPAAPLTLDGVRKTLGVPAR